MLATRPAAGTALARTEVLATPANAFLASLGLLRVLDPANPFVSRERSDVLPSRQRRLVGFQRRFQICRKIMDDAAGERRHGQAASALASCSLSKRACAAWMSSTCSVAQ